MKLICAVVGKKPELKWFKDNEEIIYGAKFKDLTDDCFGCILITKTTMDDAGEYKCVAKNDKEEISSTCQLIVFPKVENLKDKNVAPIFTRAIKGNHNSIIHILYNKFSIILISSRSLFGSRS